VPRADVTIFYSGSQPAFAYVDGADGTLLASAVTASETSNQANVDILGAQTTALAGAIVFGSAADEADWAYRSTRFGVVINHDFRAQSEVDQFREDGDLSTVPNDEDLGYAWAATNTVNWLVGDGITGGACMEITRPTGIIDGRNWYRPMSPLSSPGNGKATDDPADNGLLTLDADGAWDPGPGGAHDRMPDWQAGNYGAENFEGGTPFDGRQFWIQYALKVDTRRFTGATNSNQYGGKVQYVTRTDRSNVVQELVTSYGRYGGTPVDIWDIYRGAGYTSIDSYVDTNPPLHNTNAEWVTYLVRVVPGSMENESPPPPSSGGGNTRLQVYRQTPGTNHYDDHIIEINDMSMDYANLYTKAYNAIILSGYFNNFNLTEFWQRYDQLIFSRQWIPPRRSWSNSTLEQAADLISTPGRWTLDPIQNNSWGSVWDISWQNTTAFYDENRSEIQLMGKGQAGLPAPHYRYSEQNNQWTTVSTNVFAAGARGHIWNVSFDFTESPGDYYALPDLVTEGANARTILRYTRKTNTWAQLPNASFNIWDTGSTPNPGFVYHPNLLGPGRPGIWCWGNTIAYYDVVNETWTPVGDGRYTGQWSRHNLGMYVPGLDLIIYGCGQDIGIQGFIVTSDTRDNNVLTSIYMPGRVENGSNDNSYHMLLDPTDPTLSTIMLLHRTAGTVWTCNDPLAGASAWTQQPWQHPFFNNNPYRDFSTNDEGSTTPCSIPRYGVVAAFSSNQLGGGNLLWRPGGTLTEV
jgi:hypothetical protein